MVRRNRGREWLFALIAFVVLAVMGCSSDDDSRGIPREAKILGLALSVTSIDVALGGWATIDLTVSGNDGVPVELSVDSALSPGLTVAFDHAETTSAAVLTVSAATAAQRGGAAMVVRASIPSQTIVATLGVVVVEPARDVGIAVSPAKVAIAPGETVPITVTITRNAAAVGYAFLVKLVGLPAHLTVPPDDLVLAAGGDTAVINLTASPTAPALSTTTVSAVVSTLSTVLGAAPLEIVVAGKPGDLDTSFGEAGLAFAPLRDGPPDRFLFLKSGKILVLTTDGDESGVNDAHPRLLRLLPSGVPDPTFGVGGIVDVRIPGLQLVPFQALETSTGRIILLGVSYPRPLDPGRTAVTFTGLTPDGALDTAFGTNGFTLDSTTARYGVGAVDASGRVMAVESDHAANRWVTRLGANGLPDPSFGVAGVKELAAGPAYAPRRLVSTGGAHVLFGIVQDLRMDIVKIDSNGNVDTAFGSGGRTTLEYGFAGRDTAGGIAVQPDGKIVVAGTAQLAATEWACAVARLSATGALDASFGTGGMATTTTLPRCEGVVLQPDGKVLALGSIGGGAVAMSPAVHRFTAAGALDASFHHATPNAVAFGGSVGSFSTGQLLPDGRLLAIAQTTMNQVGVGLARFWP